jgi:hypothetical protein
MSLGERQELFTYLLAELILFIYGRGYKVRMGEVLRTKAQAEANAASGAGISNSLHLDKLAADLNLFKDGVFLTESEDHRPFGEFWKSLHEDCAWGGDFSRPDGNHYSISFDGRK